MTQRQVNQDISRPRPTPGSAIGDDMSDMSGLALALDSPRISPSGYPAVSSREEFDTSLTPRSFIETSFNKHVPEYHSTPALLRLLNEGGEGRKTPMPGADGPADFSIVEPPALPTEKDTSASGQSPKPGTSTGTAPGKCSPAGNQTIPASVSDQNIKPGTSTGTQPGNSSPTGTQSKISPIPGESVSANIGPLTPSSAQRRPPQIHSTPQDQDQDQDSYW